jgi:aspartyl-tRNA(Asn)/glutamyl-tRNA(Gln) amidotransferase subunit A
VTPNGFVHYVGGGKPGLRLAVKDNINVAGMPCAAGLQAWRGRVAERDAACVAQLKAAGYTVVGKTLMDEAAFGALGDNPWFGRCHNPHRHGFTAGGSSAGSAAAVAVGLADLALGTDTLGSVRIPASYCGVVGYVPSAGSVPMDGIATLAPSFDRVGFFTRTVAEMTKLFPADPGKDPVVGEPDVKSFDWGALRRAMLLQIEIEAAEAIKAPEDSLSPTLGAALQFGRDATREKRERAQAVMDAARKQVAAWLRRYDVLRLPATPQHAFSFDGPVPADQADYATISSLIGLPAISVPAKVAPGELPLGVQLVARKGADALLLYAAARLG